jgi:hypothetical protein
MTTQMISRSDYRPELRALSRALRDVHRSLIDFSRERYELVNGPVRSKSALLDLVLDDEAFAWLGPLSKLIVEIDGVAARAIPPTETEKEELLRRVQTFTVSSDDPNAFGSRYIALLASEPHVAMHHGELRAAERALVDPGPAAAV